MRIVHIIAALPAGGAETTLYRLLGGLDPKTYVNNVISLTDRGSMAERIEALGIPVQTLQMKRGAVNPILLARLAFWILRSRPDIVQTWMYHADLLGGVCARLVTRSNVVWNIRHSRLNLDADRYSTLWVARICAAISGWLP